MLRLVGDRRRDVADVMRRASLELGRAADALDDAAHPIHARRLRRLHALAHLQGPYEWVKLTMQASCSCAERLSAPSTTPQERARCIDAMGACHRVVALVAELAEKSRSAPLPNRRGEPPMPEPFTMPQSPPALTPNGARTTEEQVAAILAQVDAPPPEAKPIQTIVFTGDQKRLLRESYARGASEVEFETLCAIAEALGLDPLRRQCHFVKRRVKEKDGAGERWVDVWMVQVGIDGFRSKAEETGLYAGQDEPEFIVEVPAGPVVKPPILIAARVRVYRRGWKRPAVGVAYLTEFQQDSYMWQKMPRNQLAKCAEAQAFRKGFPMLAGIHEPAEFTDRDEDDGAGTVPAEDRGGRPVVKSAGAPAGEKRRPEADPAVMAKTAGDAFAAAKTMAELERAGTAYPLKGFPAEIGAQLKIAYQAAEERLAAGAT